MTARRVIIPMLSLVALAAGLAAFWAANRLVQSRAPAIQVVLDGEPGQGAAGAASEFRGFIVRPERPAPDLPLTDQHGDDYSLTDARGKVVLVFFGYTHCPDVCPLTMGKIATALGGMGEAGDRVEPVFVTTDPERDTPAVLSEYLGAFDGRIVGLTGSMEDLQQVAQAYGVSFHKEEEGTSDHAHDDDEAGYSMAHSSTLFLIDPHGQLRTSFIGGFLPDELAHDIGLLLEESQAGL